MAIELNPKLKHAFMPVTELQEKTDTLAKELEDLKKEVRNLRGSVWYFSKKSQK